MICSRCQGQNAENVKFCAHCGAPLRVVCPNCGTAITESARFCKNCGYSFMPAPVAQGGAAFLPQQVIVRQGLPGWAWAIIGTLAGLVILGGVVLFGMFPLNSSTKEAPLTQLPVVPPVIASTATLQSVDLAAKTYCPQSGGVILYWGAGFDCANDSGDPGYRQRLGDGMQDLNTGKFDNQTSAIKIPQGWSVRVYEDTGRGGASVCINSSIPNLTDMGNFLNKSTPINDNISSIKVYRDGTCGEDLAAGGEPAPWPEEDLAIIAPAAVNGNAPPACNDQTPCGCLPEVLKAFQAEGDTFVDPVLFYQQFIDEVFKEEFGMAVSFKHEFDKLYEAMKAANLKIYIDAQWMNDGVEEGGALEPECFYDDTLDGLLACRVDTGWELNPEEWGVHIGYESPAVFSWCMNAQYNEQTEDAIFNRGPAADNNQCPNPRRSIVCGTACCENIETCVNVGGQYKCKAPEGEPEPVEQGPLPQPLAPPPQPPAPVCQPWDSCCLYGGSYCSP